MQLKMYERQWHGIDLLKVPGAASLGGELPDGNFFENYYALLDRSHVPPAWIQGKINLGQSIQKLFFEPFVERTGNAPAILAVGAGRGYTEGVWAEAGGELTFHDYSSSSLAHLRARFPNASYVTGNMCDLQLDRKYDFITMITVDYCAATKQLRELLGKLAQFLKANGRIILVSCSALSWRRLLGELLKHATGHYRLRPALFWGYWYTPATLARAATSAGLGVESVHRFGRAASNPSGMAQVSFLPLAMRWNDANLALTLCRT
jgi:SAM-dependent methyltransferase